MSTLVHITTVDISLRFLVFECLKHFRSRGFDVLGVCAPGPHVREVEQAGVRVATVPMTRRVTPLADLRSLLRLVMLLRRERPHIVHTHTPKANLLGQWAALLARVPVRIASVHGLYFTPQTRFPKRLLFQLMERVAALPAHRVILINEQDARTAAEVSLYRDGKVRVLPAGMGVDLARFEAARAAAAPALVAQRRRALGIPERALVFGFVGRLVREKGLIELFDALRVAASHEPRLRALIVGPVDAEKAESTSPATAAEHGVAPLCVFTGLRRDVEALYPLMDVFVLPSHREGMPLAAIEAQAAGVPVITTDARGCREVVVPEETGLVVPAGDARALARAILRLAGDEALRRRLGDNAAAYARKRFDQRGTFAAFELEYLNNLRQRNPLSLQGRGAQVRVEARA